MNQYVVVDLGMCKVPYSNRKKEFHGANETIQIGAVLLNENYEVGDVLRLQEQEKAHAWHAMADWVNWLCNICA